MYLSMFITIGLLGVSITSFFLISKYFNPLMDFLSSIKVPFATDSAISFIVTKPSPMQNAST